MRRFRDAAMKQEDPGAEASIGEELVAMMTRVLETPREPEDAARQIAQVIVLAYNITRK